MCHKWASIGSFFALFLSMIAWLYQCYLFLQCAGPSTHEDWYIASLRPVRANYHFCHIRNELNGNLLQDYTAGPSRDLGYSSKDLFLPLQLVLPLHSKTIHASVNPGDFLANLIHAIEAISTVCRGTTQYDFSTNITFPTVVIELGEACLYLLRDYHPCLGSSECHKFRQYRVLIWIYYVPISPERASYSR